MKQSIESDHPVAGRRKRLRWGRILLAAYVALFLLFLLAPIIAVVAVSFSSANFIALPMPGLSLRWYGRIIDYEPFLRSLIVSLEVAAISAFAGLVLGVPAALWAARDRGLLARMIVGLMLAPVSVPALLLGFSLLYLLSAMTIGVSFLALCVTHTVAAIPYLARTVLAVYRSLPVEYEEAAAVLGASRLRILFDIVLPLIKPAIFAGTMFSVLISFDNLSLSFFFGGSATSTLPVVMLSYMQNQFDPSIAAIATVQMLIAVLALAIVNWVYGIEKLTAA